MEEHMDSPAFKTGDWAIYRRQKVSSSPGPRAQQTSAAPRGELYSYVVEKYWVVETIQDDGRICLRTRRGKQHVVEADDPRLRKPNWWERWWLSARFRAVEESSNGSPDNAE